MKLLVFQTHITGTCLSTERWFVA